MIIWFIAGAMLLLAVGFICYHLFLPEKTNVSAGSPGEQMNKALYRAHLADIERQYPEGGEEQKQALVLEAQRQLLSDEQSQSGQASSPAVNRGGAVLVCAAVVLLVLAAILYARIGALPDVQIRNMLENPSTTNETALRDALARRLEQKPDNFYYWVLLARLELADKRVSEGVEAYRQARLLAPGDGAVSAELAQALFIESGNQINAEIEHLVLEALRTAPGNLMALELAGIIAFAQRDYLRAINYWRAGIELSQAGADDEAQIVALQAGVARAQSLLKDQGREGDESDSAQDANEVLLSLDVELARDLEQAAALAPDSTVYVYVRTWQGPPMPLVAQRYTVGDLPLKLSFNDAMSLSSTRKLSAVKELEIIVRISLGGTLEASSGDLEGRIGPVLLDQGKNHAVIIGTRLP